MATVPRNLDGLLDDFRHCSLPPITGASWTTGAAYVAISPKTDTDSKESAVLRLHTRPCIFVGSMTKQIGYKSKHSCRTHSSGSLNLFQTDYPAPILTFLAIRS